MADTALGIFAGTGFYEIEHLADGELITVSTHFGPVTAIEGTWHGRRTVFIARHGSDHAIPPHMINYRANAVAMRQLGVTEILAVSVVGGIGLHVGDLVVPEDFLDYTKTRHATLFDGTTTEGVVHSDMSEPYNQHLRRTWIEAARQVGEPIVDGGIYGCFDGPRFETRAEIRVAQSQGVTVVGMTGVPEVVFSNELGIPYASLCIVSNPAAGLGIDHIAHDHVIDVLAERSPTVISILDAASRILAKHAV
jgi:5'-deoxy-5'-methylthioadenosine phosphorylase